MSKPVVPFKPYKHVFTAKEALKLTKPADTIALINLLEMDKLDIECIAVICVDGRNRARLVAMVSQGCGDSCLVHPIQVFQAVLSQPRCLGFILVHNHPSGSSEPSNDDFELTRRFSKAASLMGIRFLDHIVIGDKEFSSIREKGTDCFPDYRF